MKNKAQSLEALTSLRFFAALLVVCFHDGQVAFQGAPSWVREVFRAGFSGVPFFFILSGFILTYNYLPKADRLDRRSFWVARFARVYPVYAFSLALALPIFLMTFFAADTDRSGLDLAGQGAKMLLVLGLVQSWVPGCAFVWNGPAWSLSVEAFFYALFPWLVQKGSWKRLGVLAAAVAVLSLAVWIFMGKPPSREWLLLMKSWLRWSNPILWLPLFLFGMLGGRFYLRRQSIFTGRWRHVLSMVATMATLALILAIMTTTLKDVSMLLFCYALAVPSLWLIILLADPTNPWKVLLSSRFLVILGEASYALYILHRPIHEWLSSLANQFSWLNLDALSGFGLYLLLALSASLVSLKYLENPCREWIKRAWTSRGRRPSPGGEIRPAYNVVTTP